MNNNGNSFVGSWISLFCFFLFLSFFTDHVQVGLFMNPVPKINGVQFALGINASNMVNGLQLSINNTAGEVNGLQMGFVSKALELNGIQGNMITNDGVLINGIQVALINTIKDEGLINGHLNGAQFGLVNSSEKVNGIQVGMFSNRGTSLNGIQASIFLNKIVSKSSDGARVNGVQVGLVNYVDSSKKTYCLSDVLWGFSPFCNACVSLDK